MGEETADKKKPSVLKIILWSVAAFFVMIVLLVAILGFIGMKLPSSSPQTVVSFHVSNTAEPLDGKITIGNFSTSTVNGIANISEDVFDEEGGIRNAMEKMIVETTYQGKKYVANVSYMSWNFSNYKGDVGIWLENLGPRKQNIFFYNPNLKCTFNGDVLIDGVKIATTFNGSFILDEDTFDSRFKNDSFLRMNMRMDDECVKKDPNMQYIEGWRLIGRELSVIKDDFNHQNQYAYTFFTTYNSRLPMYPEEYQHYVRPAEAQDFFEYVKSLNMIKGNLVEDLNQWNRQLSIKIQYAYDMDSHHQDDWWQTPKETFDTKKGDCEDWSNAFVSLVRYYDPSLRCYSLYIPTHITTMCYLGNGEYWMYDQGKTELSTKIASSDLDSEKRKKLRALEGDYMDRYGLPATSYNVHAAYNDKEAFEFETNEEYIDWQLSLMNQ